MAKKMPGQVIDWFAYGLSRNGHGDLSRHAKSAQVASIPSQQRFPLGLVVITKRACSLDPEELLTALGRHRIGDWGDVNDEEREANERALQDGGLLLSVHHTRDGVEFWISTDPAYPITLVTIPFDY